MQDLFCRRIDYLRISVTDRCNLRCVYCMPAEGVAKQRHSDILTFEEMEEIARAAVELGVRKLRITGGEPLVRRGIVELCRRLGQIPGVEDLSMTTNAALLPHMAQDLYQAGVHRINISLDTLDEDKYRRITRLGSLADALAGLRAAAEAGMAPIKINTVLIGGFNDDEIPALADLTRRYPVELRFIELMPIGHAAPFGPEAYLPSQAVLERLPQLQREGACGVAALYRLPGALGNVGLISPVNAHFCAECNRIRLTADGKLKPCLHSDREYPIKGLDFEQMRRVMEKVIYEKPAWHGLLDADNRSHAGRNMNQIGG